MVTRLPSLCHTKATAALLLWLSLPFASAGALGAETVQALRYGVSLYHYYQRDYFNALTELGAAQKLDDLGPHTEGAELLRGGMALSYGMDREAKSIFEAQLQEPREGVDRERAWFYLGKMAWQRGDAARTASTLGTLALPEDHELNEEAHFLRASAALAQGQADDAMARFRSLPQDSAWHNYLAYNLGAMHASRAQWPEATAYFQRAAAVDAAAVVTDPDEEGESPEALALRDKSLTAAGYAQLAGGNLQAASETFRQVRLESPYATRALLGYGWSAAERGEYLEALSPWQQLTQRSLLDDSAREGLLALPYAYAQLQRPDIALQQYREAGELYTRELANLQRVVGAFREEPLPPLLGIGEEIDSDWLFTPGILPVGEFSPYLQHLVTRHRFQVALRELRDLYAMQAHLARAQQRLQVLRQVDAQQQAAWASLVEQDRRNDLVRRREALAQQQDALRQRLQQALQQEDGRLLSGREQHARWQRLARAQQVAQRIDAPQEQQHRLRLLKGLLQWQDSEQFAARAWQARQDLQELDTLAADSARLLGQVDAAIASQRQSDFAPRISNQAQRVAALSSQVGQTVALSEQTVRQVAIAELGRQEQALTRALGQSQLAIARIQDAALHGGSDD